MHSKVEAVACRTTKKTKFMAAVSVHVPKYISRQQAARPQTWRVEAGGDENRFGGEAFIPIKR